MTDVDIIDDHHALYIPSFSIQSFEKILIVITGTLHQLNKVQRYMLNHVNDILLVMQ